MKDIPRIATAIIVVIVVIFGGIGLILDKLSWAQYLTSVSVGAGLLGVGLGIDTNSRP